MRRCCRVAQPAAALKLRAPFLLGATLTTSPMRFYRTSDTAATAAATSSSSAPVSALPSPAAAPEGGPQTYFDYLDRMWNTKWFGTVDENALASTAGAHAAIGESSIFAQAFTSCQHALGVEAGALIFLFGAATRAATLFFSLYGERAGERMRLALPELKKPQEDFNRVYYNDLASAMEVQMAASVLKSHRRAVFRKYDTSNWKCVASLAMAPVVMTGLYQVSAMCENAALDVGSSSFLWCGALTLPDPFMLLPIATCVITLLNFELSLSKEIKTGWMRNIIWGARLGCLCVVPVFASFRSGVCLYLVGMNVVGLLQPLLLRSSSFRRWFGFPTAEELAAVAPASAAAASGPAHHSAPRSTRLNVADTASSLRERIVAAVNTTEGQKSGRAAAPMPDVLQASMTVQFPYLSHLLNPQVEENAELFAKARSKQSKPDFGRHGPITSSAGSRYARGTNPLMRETPLHPHGAASRASAEPTSSSSSHNASDEEAKVAAGEGDHGSAGAASRRAPKNKGSSFASSGWKTSQLSFNEDDFIPAYEENKSAPSSPSAASFFTKRK